MVNEISQDRVETNKAEAARIALEFCKSDLKLDDIKVKWFMQDDQGRSMLLYETSDTDRRSMIYLNQIPFSPDIWVNATSTPQQIQQTITRQCRVIYQHRNFPGPYRNTVDLNQDADRYTRQATTALSLWDTDKRAPHDLTDKRLLDTPPRRRR